MSGPNTGERNPEPSSSSSSFNPRPIFLVGSNRSGTKWLSNLICQHPEVAGIQSGIHHGIIETNLFDVMPKKFDLAYTDDYIGFVEIFSETDFFIASGVDKQLFYELDHRPEDFFGVFEILMNDHAIRQNCKYWFQKIQPVLADDIMKRFSNGVFIAITRDPIDTLKSASVVMERHGFVNSLLKLAYSYVVEEKMIARQKRNYDILRVTFDDLKNAREETLKSVCRHIGIEYVPEMLDSPFSKNTSFKKESDREEVFSKSDETILKLLLGLMRLVPYPVFGMLRRARKFLGRGRESRPVPFIHSTFGVLKTKHLGGKESDWWKRR